MSRIPESFADALKLDAAFSLKRIYARIDLLAAKAEYDFAKRHLSFAHEQGYSNEYIDVAMERMEIADGKYSAAEFRVEDDHGEYIRCWSSGTYYDLTGLDYTYSVSYSPSDYAFVVHRHDEADSWNTGEFKTKQEAIAYVESCEAWEIEEVTPVFTREESDQAGEVEITVGGETKKIKDVVDAILSKANQGCGLHYEIYADRAKSSLDAFQQSRRDDAQLIAKYLDHCRY
ncbi:hypothetical protein [Herbaspirillum sp. RV1423]|uniref:hypothetical protein n=1 Tax=Herbaspirillum sp. RV1423 TaxID=1443993 RepID=UPI0004B3826D|nr:hypothetical protein [Herbaspirillum sp. RV1423]